MTRKRRENPAGKLKKYNREKKKRKEVEKQIRALEKVRGEMLLEQAQKLNELCVDIGRD